MIKPFVGYETIRFIDVFMTVESPALHLCCLYIAGSMLYLFQWIGDARNYLREKLFHINWAIHPANLAEKEQIFEEL